MQDLNQLIKEYALSKQTLDDAKKQTEKLGAKIKTILKEQGNKVNLEVDTFNVSYYVVERSKTNEDKLLKTIKDLGFTDAVKTVEKVDEDVVQGLIYNGVLDAVKIQDCFTITPVETLKVTIKKGAK